MILSHVSPPIPQSPIPAEAHQQSALEMLAGTIRQSVPQVSQTGSAQATPQQEQYEAASQIEVGEEFPQPTPPQTDITLHSPELSFVQIYEGLQEEAQALESKLLL